MIATLDQFWAFLAAHKPTLIVVAAWFMREVPVVWTGLKENHGLQGIFSIIATGQTAEKQAAVAVATITAISPPPSVIAPVVAPSAPVAAPERMAAMPNGLVQPIVTEPPTPPVKPV